jgi:hypothetical protein
MYNVLLPEASLSNKQLVFFQLGWLFRVESFYASSSPANSTENKGLEVKFPCSPLWNEALCEERYCEGLRADGMVKDGQAKKTNFLIADAIVGRECGFNIV